MRGLPLVLILCTALVACESGQKLVAGPGFSTATIELGDGTRSVELDVEIAADGIARAQGLMFRQELSDGTGMLFLYPSPSDGGHWMKNTYVPLDIAYIDASATVVEVVQGRPLDEALLRPAAPYVYVLEVPSGWFEANGFGPGTQLTLPAGLPEPR